MRCLVLGGTGFIGRSIVDRLVGRGDEVAIVHRGTTEPQGLAAAVHLHTSRADLPSVAADIKRFDPEAVVDVYALTAADVEQALPVLPEVPTVVLSSQDVYEAITALRTGGFASPVPLREDAELRRERYPYRGQDHPGVPEDYEKLDVEERWLPRGAVVLRLPMVYGPHDDQLREAPILRRVLSGRTAIPVGPGTLLISRAHVDDVAEAVLAALHTRRADGRALNLGERDAYPVSAWYRQILAAAGSDIRLSQVPDTHVPADLFFSTSRPQHLLASVELATELLGLDHPDPRSRVADSVAWHLAHGTLHPLTAEEARADDEALAHALER
jgi:nucleoside-diphosphate-sugar epimerase